MGTKNISKVVYGDSVLIDLTGDTVSANTLATGITAHNASGDQIVGTLDPGGSSEGSSQDVRFIDYDGTLVASYSVDEFMELETLPSNPTHEGLISQGWNWTISEAKEYLTTNPELTIGQMYNTSDGKTKIYIHLDEGQTSPILGCCPNGTVIIDWGDGSPTSRLTGTNVSTVKFTARHSYPGPGDYIITLSIENGSYYLSGTNSTSGGSYLLRYTEGNANLNYYYRNSIRKVFIGNNVYIGHNAFEYCQYLESVTLSISKYDIYEYAFANCNKLKYITIPRNITKINDYTFYSCYSLGSISLPKKTTVFGTQAFRYCYSLDRVEVPNNTSFVGPNVFNFCCGLSKIHIPNGVTNLGSYTFSDCYGLKEISLPTTLTSIGSYAFQNCPLTKINIPNTVNSIDGYGFYGCKSLSELTIPNGITSISNYMCGNCHIMTKVSLPETVTSINNSAFSNCYSLPNINIPSEVTSIGSYAFQNCYSLGAIHFNSAIPPTVSNSNAWTNINSGICKIYVPTGSLSDYTSATNYPNPSTFTYIEE